MYIGMIIYCLFGAVVCSLLYFFIDDEGYFLLCAVIFLFMMARVCIELFI